MAFEVSFKKLQRDPYIKLIFSGKINDSLTLHDMYGNKRQFTSEENVTKEIDISGLAITKYRFYACKSPNANAITVDASISMMTPLPTRQYQVILKAVGKNWCNQWECSHMYTHWIEILRHRIEKAPFTFEIELELLVSKSDVVTFAKLFDDTDVADFTLTTPNGSLSVHKACLAAHSDFFRTMFSGDWKETEKNEVELKDVSMTTLEQLRKYLYLGTLPDSVYDLGLLYLVARCYLMEALKENCLMKIISVITSENLYNIIDFACEHNVPELVRMLLQHTKEDIIYGPEKKVEASTSTSTL